MHNVTFPATDDRFSFGTVTVDKAMMVKVFDTYCEASHRLYDIITGRHPDTGCIEIRADRPERDRPVFDVAQSREGDAFAVDNTNPYTAHGTETFSYNREELTGPEAAAEYNRESDPGIAGYYKATMSDAEIAAEYNAWLDGLKRAKRERAKRPSKGRAGALAQRAALRAKLRGGGKS